MRHFIVAIMFGLFLVAPSSGQETPPDTSAIEVAHAAWKAKANKKNRKALDEALEAYEGPPTTETVIAFLERMSADVDKKNFRILRESSLAAVKHMESIEDVIPQRYYDTQMIAAIALFNHRQKKEALIEMVEVEAHLHTLEHVRGEELEDWVRPMKYRAEAWQLAMIAYFDSANKRRPSDKELDAIKEELHPPGYHDDAAENGPPLSDRLPFCDGKYKKKRALRYPRGGVRKGMYGSVIVEVDTASDGKFQNVEVLAAVPSEGFREQATKVISTWSWQPVAGVTPGADCRLEGEGMIIPLVFSLD